MPVYKNELSESVQMKNTHGNYVDLKPGHSLSTIFFCDHQSLGLTKESDLPLWGSMAMEPTDIDLGNLAGGPYESDIDGFTGAVVPVPADAWRAYIIKISGSITVRRQVVDGPIEMLNRIDAYPHVTIECAGTITQLLVSGSGTFQIQMYRKPITD